MCDRGRTLCGGVISGSSSGQSTLQAVPTQCLPRQPCMASVAWEMTTRACDTNLRHVGARLRQPRHCVARQPADSASSHGKLVRTLTPPIAYPRHPSGRVGKHCLGRTLSRCELRPARSQTSWNICWPPLRLPCFCVAIGARLPRRPTWPARKYRPVRRCSTGRL